MTRRARLATLVAVLGVLAAVQAALWWPHSPKAKRPVRRTEDAPPTAPPTEPPAAAVAVAPATDRPGVDCEAPRWSPDGPQLAYALSDPLKGTVETWFQELTVEGRRDGDPTPVTARHASTPIVELAWAPNMKLLSRPYVFVSRGLNGNLDLFADGDWLTTGPGNNGQPAWSPDGRYIAYTAQSADSGDLQIFDLMGDPKPRRLTFSDTATEFSPQWRPKGHGLLFTRLQSGETGQDIGLILETDHPTETLRMVTEWQGDEKLPSWSPNGNLIAFYANKDTPSERTFDLWISDITGETSRKLASDVVAEGTRGPAWSPDSGTIFFVQRDAKLSDPVAWVRVDGSQRGVLPTGTQFNTEVAAYAKGRKVFLAIVAVGAQSGRSRIFVKTLAMAELKPDGR